VLQNPNDYHQYQIVYDPTTQSASMFLDGSQVMTGIAPNGVGSSSIDWGALYMGSGTPSPSAQVNFNLVQFDIVPEPSALALLAIGSMGLCVQRRFAR
jgi:hypothetical protein